MLHALRDRAYRVANDGKILQLREQSELGRQLAYVVLRDVERLQLPQAGQLADWQIAPRRFCPGSDIVMCAHQTDDLLFSIKDFSARARGVSPSGDQMEPRSKAGSFARTVHFFRKISGEERWDGGIAYDGDLSVYPADFREKGA